LEFLEGKVLPGIDCLENKWKSASCTFSINL
jgi:hypothetical protein